MLKMVEVENRTLFTKVSEANGTVVSSSINNHDRSCVFERVGTRFEITIVSLEKGKYVVAIPNFYFSIETRRPQHIGYKVSEKLKLAKVDVESIEMAIEWLMSQ
jgi:hypothetical protein